MAMAVTAAAVFVWLGMVLAISFLAALGLTALTHVTL
jgi:hypothetical protein